MLGVYKEFAESYMAMPVLTGVKSASEKFAGAVDTYAIEAMMQDRKSLQAGTSHFLGQNFAKAFDVTFQNDKGSLEHVWATSWGVSTRLVGALIMTHSDDKGLIVPPRLAPTEVVIIPIFRNNNRDEVVSWAGRLFERMKGDFRVVFDADDANSPGWKFAEWEMRGVPVRIEIGPKDRESRQAVLVRRDTNEKSMVPFEEIPVVLERLLVDIQENLFQRALDFRDQNTRKINDYADFKAFFEAEGGFADCLWCGDSACESKVKEETKATIRCIPMEHRHQEWEGKCVHCGKTAQKRVIFAKSY